MSNFYQSSYGGEPANLQFYSSAPTQPAQQQSQFYQAGRSVIDPSNRNDVVGAIGSSSAGQRNALSGTGSTTYGGPIIVANWWNAFTPWTGTEGEPPLLEGKARIIEHANPMPVDIRSSISTASNRTRHQL